MKKTLFNLALISSLLTISSSAIAFEIYSNINTPANLAQQTSKNIKCGVSSCKLYWFGIVKLGDCSYQAALKNGKMSRVQYQDTQTKGWFWLKTITTRVYGE
ncbi:MAG TPA: hypothetical protein DDW90_08670 [Cyanobacteria bacterium UBA9971]|nr:hypothetical protein [Cyanobacteria bacterium UBA9971]